MTEDEKPLEDQWLYYAPDKTHAAMTCVTEAMAK